MVLTTCKEPSFQGAAGPWTAQRVIVQTRQGNKRHFITVLSCHGTRKELFPTESPNAIATLSTQHTSGASIPTSLVSRHLLSQATSQSTFLTYHQNDRHLQQRNVSQSYFANQHNNFNTVEMQTERKLFIDCYCTCKQLQHNSKRLASDSGVSKGGGGAQGAWAPP